MKTNKCVNSNEDLLSEEQKILLNQFAQKLPSIRKKMKVSQTELGEKVGLSRQTISAIERGTIPLMWNNYLAILFYVYFNDKRVFFFPKDKEVESFERLKRILGK